MHLISKGKKRVIYNWKLMTRPLLPWKHWLIVLLQLWTVIIYILWHSIPILPSQTACFCLPVVLMKSAGLPVSRATSHLQPSNSVDSDGITCCIQDSCSPIFSSLLNYIFNISWTSYTFPLLFKSSLPTENWSLKPNRKQQTMGVLKLLQ
jgi:hypothetical protein